MTITITIPGIPAPGGSKTGFAFKRKNGTLGVNMVDAGKRNKEWRAVCAVCARQQYNGDPMTGPLGVEMRFTMPRPKGHYRTGKRANELKPNAPSCPIGKPDVLKLARSTEDALTGIVWRDDSQTVNLALCKHYGDKPGCVVTVIDLEQP